jgi:hypothetical protein
LLPSLAPVFDAILSTDRNLTYPDLTDRDPLPQSSLFGAFQNYRGNGNVPGGNSIGFE